MERLLSEDAAPLARGMLRSIVAGYFLCCRLLQEREVPANSHGVDRDWLAEGQALLTTERIDCASAISLPLFENALRLCRHRDLLADGKTAPLNDLAARFRLALSALQPRLQPQPRPGRE